MKETESEREEIINTDGFGTDLEADTIVPALNAEEEDAGEEADAVLPSEDKESLFKRLSSRIGYDRRDKKFFIGKLRISRTLLIILLAIVLIICLFSACASHSKKKMLEEMQPADAAVEKRNVAKTVTGSSTIEPKDSYSIMTITTGEITMDYINEGDEVKKGDKLYQFDPETPQNSVSTAQNALKKAQQSYSDAVKAKSQTSKTNDKSVESARIALEKARLNYNDAMNTLGDLSVKSDVSGIVSETFVSDGDYVQAGTPIASVYDDRYLKISLPFNETDAANISVGDSATLTVSGTGNELWGSVSSVSSSSVATGDHNLVRYVTVETENPGALTSNDRATAVINGAACNDAAQFEYITQRTVSSKTSGKIARLNIESNYYVSSGQTVATLDSDTARTAADTAKLNLDDATLALEKAVISSDEYSQDSAISNARLALDDARLALEKAQKGLDDYTVTAPISGTVVTKNSKAGDKIDSSNATTPMCIIYDMSSVQFDIDVDETDIAGIKVGQEVTVKADALADKVFKGVVEKVSLNGEALNGVTNYPVTVAVYDYDGLLPGMNVDAEIVVEEALNVLTVPVSSLKRGNIVYVKGEKERDDDDAPEGYKSIEVKTGISDNNYIEIKSGLKEGDMVRGQDIDLSSDLEEMMEMRMQEGMSETQGGGPSGRGEPPSGGGPSGGGPSGGGR